MHASEAEVSAAFEQFLGSYLSREARQGIEAAFGPVVLERVQEVYHRCLGCPVDWSRQSMDDALPILAQTMDTEFPWLSKEARRNIIGAFVLEWK